MSTQRKHVAKELEKSTILRFNQTLQNYLKVSVGNDVYNLTKYDRNQITDTNIIKTGNAGGYLLQQWNKKCKDINNSRKITNFIRATESKTPTPNAGTTNLSPKEEAFMYIETSGYNYGHNVFVSFETIVMKR